MIELFNIVASVFGYIIFGYLVNKVKLLPKKYINSNYNISKTILNKITTKLTHDVSYRFLYVNKKIYNIYDYKKGDKYLILKRPDLFHLYRKD